MLPISIDCFNSIKVRLRLKPLSDSYSVESLFQFHKGAIKTKESITTLFSRNTFQFHKGAIKTRNDFAKQMYAEVSIP